MAIRAGAALIQPFRILFGYAGVLSPRGFVIAAIGIYLAGAASHLLTGPGVLGWAGLWPFIVAQAMLIWMWFAVHAKRLRDAGHSIGAAIGIALVYLLSVVLLLIVTAAFFNTAAAPGQDPNPTGALTLLLLLTIFSVLTTPDYGVVWIVLAILIVAAFLPPLIALGFSVWTATRPRAASPA